MNRSSLICACIKQKIIFITFLITFAFPIDLFSYHSIDTIGYIAFPKALKEYEFVSYFGLSIAYLPKIIVEEEFNKAPLLDVNFRLGLPYNFSLSANISSIYITNQFKIGALWSQTTGNFSFALSYGYSYWLGQFKQKAFNVIANGTLNYPGFVLGYDFDDFYISLKTEAIISTFQETFIGDATTGGNEQDLVGWSFTYAIEQPLWNKLEIMQAVRINITKFFFQSWIAFTRTKNYVIFPEFILEFKL